MGRERKHRQRGRTSWGCIYFLWSYRICLKRRFLLFSGSIQLINCTSLFPYQPPTPTPFSWSSSVYIRCELVTRPVWGRGARLSHWFMGASHHKLVQTEARSSLIRELQLWSWKFRQRTGMCERERVCLQHHAFIFCFLRSANMKVPRWSSDLRLYKNDSLCPQRASIIHETHKALL